MLIVQWFDKALAFGGISGTFAGVFSPLPSAEIAETALGGVVAAGSLVVKSDRNQTRRRHGSDAPRDTIRSRASVNQVNSLAFSPAEGMRHSCCHGQS